MGRIKLKSVSDFARRGYDLRITCMACCNVTDASAVLMMQELARRGCSTRIDAMEARLKCSRCGERQASVQPCEVDF